jgi:hypothetical protein
MRGGHGGDVIGGGGGGGGIGGGIGGSEGGGPSTREPRAMQALVGMRPTL